MLMAVKWADHMLGNLIIEDRVLPPLEGIAEIIDELAPALPRKGKTKRLEQLTTIPKRLSSIPIGPV